MSKKTWLYLLPFIIFLMGAVFLFKGLYSDPTKLESVMVDKEVPVFTLQDIYDLGKQHDRSILKGRPMLLNVWATWCPTCKAEHEMLNRLAAQGVLVYGVNYKDNGDAARQWLDKLGNPYRANVEDPQGSLGINLGVYGAPETFLLDKDGIVRHKHVGAIDERVWREQLAPLYRELLDEAGL